MIDDALYSFSPSQLPSVHLLVHFQQQRRKQTSSILKAEYQVSRTKSFSLLFNFNQNKTMFSCFPRVDYIVTDNNSIPTSDIICRRIVPRLIDFLDDGLGDISPVVLVGYRGVQPVYRVTNTFATEREGVEDGQLEVHWPALFPNIIIPMCQYLQLDVTFRNCNPFQLSATMEDGDDTDYTDHDVDDGSVIVDDDDYNNNNNNNNRDAKYLMMWTFELDNIRWWE